MSGSTDVAIIGAGPYGLSLAAYLGARGIDFRIFGSPMSTWATQMPAGMCLKSEGFASTLYDPHQELTLAKYCAEKGIPYADTGSPVKLETFVAYGQEFQRRLVPNLENRGVVGLRKERSGFKLLLDNGEEVAARRVVAAVGISHFNHVPPELTGFSKEYVTHSSDHSSVARFAGKDVTVIGAGASALDLAALLREAGASARVITRKPEIHFHNPPTKRTLIDELKAPQTGLGPGWRSWLCVKGPLVFHKMPFEFRQTVVKRHLGPAPAWFTRDRVLGQVELLLNTHVESLSLEDGRPVMHLSGADGKRTLVTDHVIAGTGFEVDLRRLDFLDGELLAQIRSAAHAPVLTSNFESTVKGLYFIGAAAAPSFGPLLRFAYGAGFSSRHLSAHLARGASPRRREVVQTTKETADEFAVRA